jgi:hypothetical protein
MKLSFYSDDADDLEYEDDLVVQALLNMTEITNNGWQ